MKIRTQTNITFFTDIPDKFISLREKLGKAKGLVIVESGNSPAVLASAAEELAIISTVIPGDDGGKAEDNSDLIFIEALNPDGNRVSLTDELLGDNNNVVKLISAAYKQEGYKVKITKSKI